MITVFTGGKSFLLNKTRFASVKQIPQHLLESVSTCYSQRIQACTWCFLTYLPSTKKQLQSISVVTTGICRKCLRNNGTITVIPASNLCETSCYGNFVAIPPTPNHTDNIKSFQCCKKYEKVSEHKKCLQLTRRGNAWFPHSIEEMVIWTIEYKTDISFDTVYKQHCRVPPPTPPVQGPLADTNSDKQQHNIQLYCGYCNIQYETPVDLVEHCKQDLHKDAVFADSGRDVFWQFEPPPAKEHNISAAIYGLDKSRELNKRINRRRRNKAKEIPFGLKDKLVKHEVTETIFGLETKLKCFSSTANTPQVLAAEGEKINWTLLIKGNQHHSFRGVRFNEESVFKMAQVLHCTTKQNYKIEENMCCSPDNKPGLLLGLVRIDFWAVPKKCDVYKNKILIDVGLSKCLSVPLELKVVTPKLYKLNKCLRSGKLLLEIEGVFSNNSKLKLKEMSPSSISVEDKALIKKYSEQLKQRDLYSNNCATLLESTDQTVYYEKLCMLLYLEGDHRRRLLQRVSKKKILAKLTFIKGPPSLEVELQDLGDAELAECSSLLKNAPSIRLQFLSDNMCSGAKSHIWECSKEIIEDVLRIQLPQPPSFPTLPKLDRDGECFSIAFEFSEDFTHLAKCHAAIKSFKSCELNYLLFPSNQVYYPSTKSFTCKSPLKKWDTELNPQQVSAMEAILLSESVLPVIIAGPFGTGKTFLLSKATEYLVKHTSHYRILICTLTNSAANVYLEHFHKRIPSDHNCKILRLVYKQRKLLPPPRLQKYFFYDPSIMQFHYPTESQAEEYHIIVTTLGMAQEILQLKLAGHFTHIFIDEAAQVTIPEVMMALSLASNTTKVVLAGDHMQLDPEVYSPLAKEYDLHKSPLEQIYGEYSELHHSKHKVLLTHNYRTHSDILKLPSKFFYRDKLRSCGTVKKHPDYKPLMLLSSDVKENDKEMYLTEFKSYLNVKEAENILNFLKESLLPKWPVTEWGRLNDNPNSIGILTTEYAQVCYIRTRLKKEKMPRIFVDTFKNAQGCEFRVVILSVVRTHHSINKDSVHKCGFYTEKRVLNTAFTRVQSLIVTAAHPLSLITRGHMTCRLFWASYLSESLSDEECDQLSKEFVSECQVGKVANHWQLSPEDYELYSILIKDQTNTTDPSNDKGYYDQILSDLEKQFVKDSAPHQNSHGAVDTLDNKNYHGQIISDLEKDFDSNQGQSLAINTTVQASLPHVTQTSAVLPVTTSINTVNNPSSNSTVNGRTNQSNRFLTVAAGSNYLHNNAAMARSSASVTSNTDSDRAIHSSSHNHNSGPRRTNRGSRGVGERNQGRSHRVRVRGLHSSYITLPPNHNRQLFTLTVIKGAEAGYALTLDPKVRDIWLPDSSALNRSMRGDTVAIDLLGTRNNKGIVVANMSSISYNHPKEYFICRTDRNTYNLLVPIDKQYPKIDSLQKVEVDGLSIFADRVRNSIACNIKFKDIGKNVYLVRLDLPWTEGHVYPKGVPVKHIKLEGDLTTFLNILKFNYIPSMPTNNGKFLPYILNEAMQQFPRDWEIPVKEKRKRKIYKDVFTIDDEETVVLDDALSLDEDKKNNCYIVNVHIADASYFVKPGSALDRAASERGRTFYINYEDDRTMFMLPDNICMEHGSLQAGKERLAVTTQFVFSKEGYSLLSQLSDVEVHRSIVCSVCRLTKEDVGKYLLENSMDKPVNVSTEQFSKIKRDLYVLGEIANKLRKCQWPDSYLYEPDRGKQDKYSLAGSSLVEMFMCLCNAAIPAKLLKRDGRVGPVVVHEPIKHYKQHEWLEHHYHLLKCCPIFKRMISDEVIESFNDEHQLSVGVSAPEDDSTENTIQDDQGITAESEPDNFIKVSKENWDKISHLASKHDSRDLTTFLCSLQYFPELYVAYRQLCMSNTKSFYHVIDSASAAQSQKFKHSHFGMIYTHFTSPLRRYCDILVHRAVLSRNSSLPSMELIHKMNIHKWDEREFSRQRKMLYLIDCCRRETGAIAMTAYVGKFTNKVVELHALPELQEILPDRICEMKLSHLQTKCDAENKHLLKWNVEIIPASSKRSSKKESDSKEHYDLVEIPLSTLGATIEALHKAKFKEAKKKIKTFKVEFSKCSDVEQEVKQSCHKLTITKYIREYSKLDIQLTSSQTKSYAIEPTVSLVHISQTFSCCLLHVKSPIQCYAPNISKFAVQWSPTAHNISAYVESWQSAVEAESITNSTTSSRVPLIIKDLRLKWVSSREAQFSVNARYRIEYQRPFDYGDYVCIQYRNLLSNPKSQYFELDESKKITWVAHGRIISGDDDEDIKITFPDNTILPETPLSDKLCYLEVIPLQITFRRIKLMFHKLKEAPKFVQDICCRDYNAIFEIPMEISEGDGEQLNQGQREALETALMGNKLLLVQGPPGTGKSMLCVEMIKQFIDYNYDIKIVDRNDDRKSDDRNDDETTSRGPTVLYCAPSNKAVNVGACAMVKKYHAPGVPDHDIHIVRVYGTIIEEKKFPGLNKIPSLAKRRVSFKNDEDFSTVPKMLEPHSLHFKIRDENSQLREVKEFIKHENRLLSEEFLRALQQQEDYEKLETIRKEYTALKKKAELAVLRKAQVIFCTCAEAGSIRIKDSIHQAEQCIIDECGMCTEPETLLPMILSKKIILVGDHKQLQPVVLNKTAESLGLKISMFQRLFKDEKIADYCIMLTEQYRMRPSICDFPSSQFYDGKLKAAKKVMERRWDGKLPTDIWKQAQTQRCVFIHVEGNEDVSGIDAKGSYEESKFNEMEADEVKFVITKLLQNKIPEKEIMVLTPYRAQKDHIRELLPKESKVDVSTVHESQGRECDVVILTTVRSLPEEDIPDHPSHPWVNENMGFVTDEHLMNVAITRAKEALCIIGNQSLLKKHLMWKDLLTFYAEGDCIIQHRGNTYELVEFT